MAVRGEDCPKDPWVGGGWLYHRGFGRIRYNIDEIVSKSRLGFKAADACRAEGARHSELAGPVANLRMSGSGGSRLHAC
jgi:hypothetical protein